LSDSCLVEKIQRKTSRVLKENFRYEGAEKVKPEYLGGQNLEENNGTFPRMVKCAGPAQMD